MEGGKREKIVVARWATDGAKLQQSRHLWDVMEMGFYRSPFTYIRPALNVRVRARFVGVQLCSMTSCPSVRRGIRKTCTGLLFSVSTFGRHLCSFWVHVPDEI